MSPGVLLQNKEPLANVLALVSHKGDKMCAEAQKSQYSTLPFGGDPIKAGNVESRNIGTTDSAAKSIWIVFPPVAQEYATAERQAIRAPDVGQVSEQELSG